VPALAVATKDVAVLPVSLTTRLASPDAEPASITYDVVPLEPPHPSVTVVPLAEITRLVGALGGPAHGAAPPPTTTTISFEGTLTPLAFFARTRT
jgi:hypothetical protein